MPGILHVQEDDDQEDEVNEDVDDCDLPAVAEFLLGQGVELSGRAPTHLRISVCMQMESMQEVT